MKRMPVPGCLSIAVIIIFAMTIAKPAYSQVLRGNVSKDLELLRLKAPLVAPGRTSHNLRIHRKQAAPPVQAQESILDSSAFKPGLNGQVARNGLGIVNADNFTLPNHFDIGADRNSRELVLAWEKWHKQLAGAIYKRWNAIANSPGRASVTITVQRDLTINANIVTSTGSRNFDLDLLESIKGLDGNQGLTFPAKSQRQVVSFRGDYIAGTGIQPGYSWIKGDYERIIE
jgi:hypothetical protein